ncbi:thioesterase II family protein [Chromobacterium sp. CV08]|uniref:thioesterase II family protein n=1 Tax=Chromobacterium sp. CV08 TaxID=3133274 RepID=UPI003DA84B9E
MPDSVLSAMKNRPDAAVQMLFLHHAGGSSFAYMQLAHGLSAAIEPFCLDLAGRGSRFLEPFQEDAEATLAEILAAIRRRGLGRAKPLLLFGHSLGAELAYQLARRLRRESPAMRLGLILSGRGFVEPGESAEGPDATMSDAEILRLLEQYGGTPPEVLAQPELRRHVIDAMRNDLRLLQSLCGLPKPALDVRADVVGGDLDHRVPPAGLARWGRALSVPAAPRIFAGGHFYLFSEPRLIPWIEERAAALAAQVHPVSERLSEALA